MTIPTEWILTVVLALATVISTLAAIIYRALSAEIATLGREVSEMKADVRALRQSFSELKGGVRTLLGAASMVGAGIAMVAQWLLGKH